MARRHDGYFLLPGLPRFLDAYPDISLHISEAHQALDMVREGFDCMLRAGELHAMDSGLIRAPPGDARARHLREPPLYRPVRHARVGGRARSQRAHLVWSASMRPMRPKSRHSIS